MARTVFEIPRRVLATAIRMAAWASSVMAISSYFAYTTAGFDFETPTSRGVDARYYRVRWDDGSTWIGAATQPVARPARPLDWFDLGGTLLDAPTRPRHRSRWNDWGFWRVTEVADDPYVTPRYVGATSTGWWACPSWLVPAVLWSGPVRRLLARRMGRLRGRRT